MKRRIYALAGVLVLLMAGMVYAWSVMARIINTELNLSQGTLSLTFTIVMIAFCVGGFIAGWFSKKVKPKYYVMISAVLFFAGFMLASMTNGAMLLYLGFGVFAGFASGFAYNAVMSTVCAWYPDKPGLISGILLMGFGISSFIVGKAFVAVTPATDVTSWRLTFRAMAIIMGGLMIALSFLFRRPGKDDLLETGKKDKAAKEPASDISVDQMVRKRSFWCYYIYATLISGAGLALVSQAGGIAAEVDMTLTAGSIANLVGMISILNGVGRVIFGAIFDKKGYRFSMVMDMILFALTGVIILLALNLHSVPVLTIGFLVGGFAYGGISPTNSAIISDFYGRSNFAVNFSIINTNLIFSSVASTIAGRLYDQSQSYVSTIIMIVGLAIASFIFFIGVKRPEGK